MRRLKPHPFPSRPGPSRAPTVPRLVLLTDRTRLADPLQALGRLPRGSAVILRDYDDPRRPALAGRLAAACRGRGLVFLVGEDVSLAARVGAGGVHFPERLVATRLRRARRLARPGWLITAAAHSPRGIRRAAAAGADLVLLSPVFATASHPGAPCLGPLRFARFVRRSPLPVIALGGLTAAGAQRLRAAGWAGVAAIGALAVVAAAQSPPA